MDEDFVDVFTKRLSIFTNVAILVTLVIVALLTLKDVLQPFFIALGVYFVLKPGADKLSENGFPRGYSYFTMFMLFLLVIVSAAYVSYSQVENLSEDEEKMERYQENLQHKWKKLQGIPGLGGFIGTTEDNGSVTQTLAEAGLIEGGETNLQGMFVGVMSAAGSMFTTFITVIFFLIFIIFEANLLPGRIVAAFPGEANATVKNVVVKIEESINTYIIVKTGVSIGTALCVMAILLLFGVDLWFIWGLLTFLLNYVPYIGSLIATIPPIILGLAVLPTGTWAFMVLLLIVNQQVWGNFIETKWTGTQLDISPVLLLLIVAFSFWLWGIIGMILSVPLFVITKIVLENIPTTRPIAILMSESAPDLVTAYERALADGELSEEEISQLGELRDVLGLSASDDQVVAELAAIHMALEGKDVSGDPHSLILAASSNLLDSEQVVQIDDALCKGELSEEVTTLLEYVQEKLEEENESD